MREKHETLTDLIGRTHDYLRISVTDRCNLRCRYCVPPEGAHLAPRSHILTLEEIERLVRLFVSLGVAKIRITGGEPMVRRGLMTLLGKLGAIPGLETLAMTTNGSLLEGQVAAIVDAGVSALNFSLDTFRRERYARITGRDRLGAVFRAIEEAMSARLDAVKINCVVIRGVNDDELLDFVAFTKAHPVSVRFIEYMPFGGTYWSWDAVVPFAEMSAIIQKDFPLVPVRPRKGETARRYTIAGHAGTVGFITPMTHHFCGTCNRLRLTADGLLKNCLFRRGSVNLKDLMRQGASDGELVAAIRRSVREKHPRMGGHQTIDPSVLTHDAPMFQVGG